MRRWQDLVEVCSYRNVSKTNQQLRELRRSAVKQTSIIVLDAVRRRFHAQYFAAPPPPLARPDNVPTSEHRSPRVFVPTNAHSKGTFSPATFTSEPYVDQAVPELQGTRKRERVKELPPGFDAHFLRSVRRRLREIERLEKDAAAVASAGGGDLTT